MHLFDKTFWLQVIVGAILIVGIVCLLKPWKAFKKVKEDKYSRMANEIVLCIMQSKTHAEVKLYQDESEQFYINNFDFLGYDRSIELFEMMTDAVMCRTKQLNDA